MKFFKGWTFTGTQVKGCGYTEETTKTIRNRFIYLGLHFSTVDTLLKVSPAPPVYRKVLHKVQLPIYSA